MGAALKISMRRIDGARFEATNAAGNTITLDGPPDLGGTGAGMRPMETVLVALAGCSAMDMLHIMAKQRQPLADLVVEVSGQRADTTPAVFTDIEVTFTASGDIDPAKLQRAADLSMEKYCSVARMLQPHVQIRFSAVKKA